MIVLNRKHAFSTQSLHLKKMYTAGDGNTAIFYLKDAHATMRSFTEAPGTRFLKAPHFCEAFVFITTFLFLEYITILLKGKVLI